MCSNSQSYAYTNCKCDDAVSYIFPIHAVFNNIYTRRKLRRKYEFRERERERERYLWLQVIMLHIKSCRRRRHII